MENIGKIKSISSLNTKEIAQKLSKYLQKGDIVCLCGELGSGKTTFTQGLLSGLEFSGYVHSPSFVIVNKYPSKIPVAHIDLYRFENIKDIQGMGIDEYLYGEDEIVIIEWADKIKDILPDDYFLINFEMIDENIRILTLSAKGEKVKDFIKFYDDINHR